MFAKYGSTLAGLSLQSILQNLNDNRISSKIGGLIDELHEPLSFLSRCTNWRMYEYMWQTITKDYRKRAKDIILPLDVATHLQTTITGISRQKRRKYLIASGELGKRRTAKLVVEYQVYLDEFRKVAKQL